MLSASLSANCLPLTTFSGGAAPGEYPGNGRVRRRFAAVAVEGLERETGVEPATIAEKRMCGSLVVQPSRAVRVHSSVSEGRGFSLIQRKGGWRICLVRLRWMLLRAAQLGNSVASGAKGPAFESRRAHQILQRFTGNRVTARHRFSEFSAFERHDIRVTRCATRLTDAPEDSGEPFLFTCDKGDLYQDIFRQPCHLDRGSRRRVLREGRAVHGVELRKVVHVFQKAGGRHDIRESEPGSL